MTQTVGDELGIMMATAAPRQAAGTRAGAHLCVLGGFRLSAADRPVGLPANAQRVLAYLALAGSGQRRDVLAGRLWPAASQNRAHANLRTAVWRVRQQVPSVVDCRRDSVALGSEVSVDYHDMGDLVAQLLHRQLTPPQLRVVPFGLLSSDLLPGWDDDWLLIDRERHRQQRMHALEALSSQLTDIGEFGLAIDSAFAAIGIEPLWESATHALLRACIAEGNRAEALRQFEMFCHLLADETGLRPSAALLELMRPVLAGAAPPALRSSLPTTR